MDVFWVFNGKLESQLTVEHEKTYEEANTLFVSMVIRVLVDHLQDVYFHKKISNHMWDALNNDYGGSDTDTELYIIEQYHNYLMLLYFLLNRSPKILP
jgi:hypothetical protein